jgi:hypothetical protein
LLENGSQLKRKRVFLEKSVFICVNLWPPSLSRWIFSPADRGLFSGGADWYAKVGCAPFAARVIVALTEGGGSGSVAELRNFGSGGQYAEFHHKKNCRLAK